MMVGDGAAYARLQTIPGVGPRIALALLLAGPARLPRLAAGRGLCRALPAPLRVGPQRARPPAPEQARDGRLRRLLYLGAWAASRATPACQAL